MGYLAERFLGLDGGPLYNFVSGWGGILVGCTFIGAWYRKHNCHELGCWRLAWHPDHTGHPVCKVHHSDHPKGTT